MAHKLNLGMYCFRIKPLGGSDTDVLSIDEFLQEAYHDVGNKFIYFCDDILNTLKRVYKTKDKDLGAVKDQERIDPKRRILDLMLDGGITGIKQSLISPELEERTTIPAEDTVALPFFVRFWMQESNVGYIFIQSYTTLSIRKLISEVLQEVLRNKEFSFVGHTIKKTTTRLRMQRFLDSSTPIAITIVNKTSEYNPTDTHVSTARIQLKGDLPSIDTIDKQTIRRYTKNKHGIELKEADIYHYKITYQSENERGEKEERTVPLEYDLSDSKLIPNIVVPSECIDEDNYPIWDKMEELCDHEITQILKELDNA